MAAGCRSRGDHFHPVTDHLKLAVFKVTRIEYSAIWCRGLSGWTTRTRAGTIPRLIPFRRSTMLGPDPRFGWAVGALCGAALRRHVPERVKKALLLTCGVIAIGIGASSPTRSTALCRCVTGLADGRALAELYLEHGVECWIIRWLRRTVQSRLRTQNTVGWDDPFIVKFVSDHRAVLRQRHGHLRRGTGSWHDRHVNILLAKSVPRSYSRR